MQSFLIEMQNGEIDDEVLYAATLGLISIISLNKASDDTSKRY